MNTLAEFARSLNATGKELSSVLDRFEIASDRANLSAPCAAFLRTVVHLRILGIPDESILKLWETEKKLVQHLHLAATGSPTWYIDSCGKTSHPERRLFLTCIDIGFPITSQSVQPGLDFGNASPTLFTADEMGEDTRRLIDSYLTRRNAIIGKVNTALPHLREALRWGTTLAPKPSAAAA